MTPDEVAREVRAALEGAERKLAAAQQQLEAMRRAMGDLHATAGVPLGRAAAIAAFAFAAGRNHAVAGKPMPDGEVERQTVALLARWDYPREVVEPAMLAILRTVGRRPGG